MKRLVLLVVTALAGCAGMGADGNTNGDAGGTGDAVSCDFTILFDPSMPTADPLAQIRAQATLVGAPGVYTYSWSVLRSGTVVPFTFEASDHSQIGFVAPIAGFYSVTVDVSGGAQTTCSHASSTINVGDPNANSSVFRLRTVASPTLAPPQETVFQIPGGADYTRSIALDPGISLSGVVRNGAAGPGVAAYVKLMPVGTPTAFTEVFASSTGTFSAKLMGTPHDVLVIPSSTALAPKLLAWTTGGATDFVVGAGTVVSGIVRNPAGNGFGGAKVQLFASGVPSTIATTAADGSFSVHTDFGTATMIKVQVTPPAATGLPRLEATGMFDLGQQVQVTYASGLATCDVGGDPVKRGGTNQPGAKVTMVGGLIGAGSVTTGTTSINANGTIRIQTTANGSGVLPSTLVPRSTALSAVIQLSTTDYAVDPVDTSACAAQTIDALAQITRGGTTSNASGLLAGVRIEATPVGPLAQADAQPVVTTSTTGGAFSIALAAGGRYDVRFSDPQARAAPLAILDVAPASVPGAPTLPKALTMSGKVSISTNPNPVVGASIQLLCASCTGIEATRPISQTATDTQSNYRIAVPDPGTM